MLTLNTVWKMEISTLLMAEFPQSGKIANRIYIRMPKMTAPKTLKDRWITEARFPFLPDPALDKSAVTQVPMFWPRVMKIAEFHPTIPFMASVCKMPTEADEL